VLVAVAATLPLWFTAVPGLHGWAAWLTLGLAAIAAASAAVRARRRPGWTLESMVAAAVVFAIALLGLSRLVTSLQVRDAEYHADRGVSYRAAEGQVQAQVGIDPQFIALLARAIPKDGRFYVLAGPKVTTSGPHSWAQYELMPRIEEYWKPCRAKWIVLVDATGAGNVTGVRLGKPIVSYKPGYALARNLDRCTR